MPLPISEYVPQFLGSEESARLRRTALKVWGLTVAVAGLWVAAFFAAPLLRSGGHGLSAFVVYRVFSPLCHQIPERSFHLAGYPLAVCARCTGLYVGGLAGLLLYPLARPLTNRSTPRRGWLFVAAAPTLIDFALGFFGVWDNTHWSRFLTALVAGAACAFYVVPGLVDMCAAGFRAREAPRAPARG